MNVRAIAFHLPQFHPIPENDEWWGPGFTEWTNVVKAKPLFPGHHQPHLPRDLGFYDLRLPEVRQKQADLAREHGVHGFCYYHYWFNGRRILERPVDDIIELGEPDLPFCLCWANENWTRRWDGADSQVLLRQNYSDEDDRDHLRWLARAFADPRYIRVDGKPVFLVYRLSCLPNPERTAEVWREEAQRLGVGEIFLCAVESFWSEFGIAPLAGFDAAVEFAPDWKSLPKARRSWNVARALARTSFGIGALARHRIFPYEDLVKRMLAKPEPSDYERFPCVTPSWDNSARRQRNGMIFVGSTPDRYERWLRETVDRLASRPVEHRILFINAWNEWGEGAHLEPDQQWGSAYLQATRSALEAARA